MQCVLPQQLKGSRWTETSKQCSNQYKPQRKMGGWGARDVAPPPSPASSPTPTNPTTTGIPSTITMISRQYHQNLHSALNGVRVQGKVVQCRLGSVHQHSSGQADACWALYDSPTTLSLVAADQPLTLGLLITPVCLPANQTTYPSPLPPSHTHMCVCAGDRATALQSEYRQASKLAATAGDAAAAAAEL